VGEKITGSLIQIRNTVVTNINTVKMYSTNRRLKFVYCLIFYIFITGVALLKSLCPFYSWRIFPPFDTVGGRDSKSEAGKPDPTTSCDTFSRRLSAFSPQFIILREKKV
jgi:hypothetical protein